MNTKKRRASNTKKEDVLYKRGEAYIKQRVQKQMTLFTGKKQRETEQTEENSEKIHEKGKGEGRWGEDRRRKI